jgi:membrane associated rhomboid family serine protease
MIPYKDENPTVLTPYVTLGFIALNVLAWVFAQGLGATVPLARSVCELGLVPGELLGTAPPGSSLPIARGLACVVDPEPRYFTLLSSMFMHGGWLHLIGNMWFLWVFGNNIEDSMGHGKFALFYLLSGLGAAAAQIMIDPDSIIPMVGASGAISGVMGGYILLYPHVRVYTLIPLGFYMTTAALPAYIMLGYWFVLQILGGLPSLAGTQRGGTAFMAHVGGFVVGLALVKLFETGEHRSRRRSFPSAQRAHGGWR